MFQAIELSDILSSHLFGIKFNNFIMKRNAAVPPEGKVPYYRSDGTGRDTYIRDHNGGLLSKDRIHSLQQIKTPK